MTRTDPKRDILISKSASSKPGVPTPLAAPPDTPLPLEANVPADGAYPREDSITIERLAYGGDGVGRLEGGKTVFVPATVPGDIVSIRVAEDHERYARGRLIGIEKPSVDRVEPPCPYADICGGCPWQHISYEAQLHWKRRSLVGNLIHVGHFSPTWAEETVASCKGSKRQWGYRNKVEFEVGHEKGTGHLVVGLHASGNDAIVPIKSCLLLPPRLRQAPKALTGALRFAAGSDPTALDIERVGVRTSLRTNDTEIALWTKAVAFPRSRVATILSDAIKASSVVRVLLKGTQKERKVGGVEVLSGRGVWTEKVGDELMSISAPSFFQVNTAQAEELVALVMEGLSPLATDSVALDLYSGAGMFTLPLARAVGDVSAVEAYGSSVRDLRRNVAEADLDIDVIGGDVSRELAGLGPFDIAVVDPPRAGLSREVLDAFRTPSVLARIRRIAYVSCDSATLARDLEVLAGEDGPYRIVSITPVDMFPQTYHVETVCILEPRVTKK
jgi:23S rRNA (uracil1939-C5)-methyltransferase